VATKAIAKRSDQPLVLQLRPLGRDDAAEILIPLARSGEGGMANGNSEWHGGVVWIR